VFPETVQLAEADGTVGGGGADAGGIADASPRPDRGASCIDTVVVEAAADTYIAADYRDTNYGTDPDMIVGRSQGDQDDRLLLDFDLSGVVWSGQVVDMRVVLTHSSDSGGGRLGLYALAAPWQETQATWLVASAASSWSTAGGDFASSPVATTTIARNARRGDQLAWSIPTTSTITSTSVASTGPRRAFGWLVQSEEDGAPCTFTTREGAANAAPRLEIDLQTCE
jgi:hypothetical protein